jgi:hypothetical protein
MDVFTACLERTKSHSKSEQDCGTVIQLSIRLPGKTDDLAAVAFARTAFGLW